MLQSHALQEEKGSDEEEEVRRGGEGERKTGRPEGKKTEAQRKTKRWRKDQ